MFDSSKVSAGVIQRGRSIVDIVLGGSAAGEIDWMFADNPVDTRPDFQVGVDILNDLSP
jgi:hypothetical protein